MTAPAKPAPIQPVTAVPPRTDSLLSMLATAASWLTPRRIRAQAIILSLCLWGICVYDFSSPGVFDRAGNIKFQDFLPIYISARLVYSGRAQQLYDQGVMDDQIRAIVNQPGRVRLVNLYSPGVALFFSPLAPLSFPSAARIWVALSVVAIFLSLYFVWRTCPNLSSHAPSALLCALAFPPLFHFFVRGQLSALLLLCFSAAFLAFRADRHWLAGIALGFLIFKPQFLVALPLILLFARAWSTLLGLVLSAAAQLIFTRISFGPAVTYAYFDRLWHISRVIGSLELSLAPIQMHSLRAFWTLLVPWPVPAFMLYLLTSLIVVVLAAVAWRSSAPLALRFSALTLAAVLVNPHLFVYDLLVLAVPLLLLADWTLANPDSAGSPALAVLLYLACILPLFGPLARWTHLQLSVPALAALLWTLWRTAQAFPGEPAS